MNKTPITILQEMMIKRGEVPSYECINQTGPHHLATFEYKCVAGGVTVTATARSKKEAKQEAARRVLAALNASAGVHAPSSPPPQPAVAKEKALPSSSQSGGADEGDAGGAGAGGEGGQWRSYVALLKELCEEFRLGAVQYELVGDTGPPHNRRFTMSATLGRKSCTATASTKKQARQLAAEQLYVYLRENLSSVTKDFVEKSDPKVRVKTEKAEKVEDEVAQGSPRKRKSETEEDQQTKRNCDLDTLFQSIDRLSEDALSRALDKVMARYVDMQEEQQWRPDLSQRIADYHRGLLDSVSEEQLKAAEAVEREARGTREHAAEELRALAEALGLSVEVERLAGEGGDLSVVSLGRTAPQLALAGRNPGAAAAAALRYVRRALAQDRAEPLLPGSLRL